MSVVGIDFGNDNCYISVARQGGIETIANDYSLRNTPSYVAFQEKQRVMGVSAKSNQMTNVSRTFFGFKRLLGRNFEDPHVQKEKTRFPYEILKQPDGSVGVSVNYNGKTRTLTPEQLTASLFTKLKDITETALQTKINDVVISVPCYFTNAERRSLLDAAKMAGLNVLKLMNETTATALAYGIYKQDLPDADKPARNVVFVDCGHTSTQVAACSFNKGKLSVLSYASEDVGGRDLDEIIAKSFCDEFAQKYKLNVQSNKRASLKLLTEVDKLKKQMSANTNKLPIAIECFMNDIDVKGHMDRATFEELAKTDLAKIEAVLARCLEASNLKKEDIYSVEVVGGSSRTPSIKTLIEKIYGKTPSTTLNADEAVSRGCALQCAILSPIFKVREFSVTDLQPYPVKLVWKGNNKSEAGDMEVFPQFHAVPFSKMLTFYKNEPFSVAAEYAGDIPYPNKHIGDFEVGEIKPTADGSNQKVKVKVRLNPNGIFSVASASLVEKHEIEEEVPVEMEVDKPEASGEGEKAAEGGEKMDTGEEKTGQQEEQKEQAEEKKEEGEKKEEKKEVKMEKRKKTVTKNTDLSVTSVVLGSLSRERLETASTEETEMANQDRNEADRLTAKNAVEEYIYDIRGKISDELEEYILEEDRNKYTLELEDAENWLYEDGEYADKPVYTEKLSSLKSKGEAVKRRKYEFENRRPAMEHLGQCLQLAQKAVDAYKSGDEKYNHIDKADVDKVQKLIQEKSEWFNRVAGELNKLSKTADPSTLASQFVQEKEQFWATVSPILNKPKPKVEPPPKEPEKAEEGTNPPADAAAGKGKEGGEKAEAEGQKEPADVNGESMSNMDVD